MAPQSSYPADVPNPTPASAPSTPGRLKRIVGRRVLSVLALLALVLVPMQGPAGQTPDDSQAEPVLASARTEPAAASGAQSESSVAGARTESPVASAPADPAVVSLTLGTQRISTRKRAKVRVVVTPSPDSGRIVVVARSGGTIRQVGTRLTGGKATVKLPRLPQGVYRVRAKLLPAGDTGSAIGSGRARLRVVPTVKVGVSVAPARVRAGKRAVASVRVSSPPRSVRGKVSVKVVGKGASRMVTGRVRAGKASVRLPALSAPGKYKVRAVFAGTKRLARGKSSRVSLTVLKRKGSGPRGACLPGSHKPGAADSWGGCWPGPNNTGVPQGTKLTAISGDRTIKTDGQVVSGWNVNGCIIVDALDVTIKNTRARCISLASGSRARYCHFGESSALRALTGCTVVRGLSDNSNPATNDRRVRIQDSTIDCGGVAGRTVAGIGDRNMTVVRVDISGCENGFDADSYMTIVDSYIHDLYNSTQGDPHTDGLQSGVGARLVLSHNVFFAFTPPCTWPHGVGCNGTAAINIGGQRDQATSSNTTISRNLIAGGAYTMYCPFQAPSSFRITQNQFSEVYSPKIGEFGPTYGCRGNGIVSSGNVRLKPATGKKVALNP